MAGDPARMQTSGDIAEHAGTNPVVVRRVLGRLKDAGPLISVKGHAGGWQLARAPESITLADVYVALEESLVTSGVGMDTSDCSLETALHQRVAHVLQDVEESLVRRLGETTILDSRAK